MFSVATSHLLPIKAAADLIKSETVNISAREEHITLFLHNRNTGLLFFHRVPAKVDKEVKFAINVERFSALFKKDGIITFDYDGSAVNFKHKQSHGLIESHKPFFEPWPKLQTDSVGIQELIDDIRFLNITNYANVDVLAYTGKIGTDSVVCAADPLHGVVIPIENKMPDFTMPLRILLQAQRIFKDNVRAVVQDDYLYFTHKTEQTRSILRFGGLAEATYTLDLYHKLSTDDSEWDAKGLSTTFDNIINDYKMVEDKDRVGTIDATLKENKLTMMCKTKHGIINDSIPVKATGIDTKFSLNVKFLADILRLEGDITFGVKKNFPVFFIENPKAFYFCRTAD